MVLDASVTLKWLLRDIREEAGAEHAVELAQAVAQARMPAVQPSHWLPEVAAGLARLSPETAEEDCATLQMLDLPVANNHAIIARACRLATDLKHHLFDTLYHAIALEMDAVLVTADRRYLHKASHLSHIADLPNWREALDYS